MADSRSKVPVASPASENAALLAIHGELTLANLPPFRQNVLAALSSSDKLVLCLEGAEYLDAAAFQCIYALRLEAIERGLSLVIENASDAIRSDAALLGMMAAIDGSGPTKGN